MSPIPNGQIELAWVQPKETFSYLNHSWIDFHNIHFGSFFCPLHRCDADPQADTENILRVGVVGMGQPMEHVGEDGQALLCLGVIDILRQVVIEVVTHIP